MQLSSYMGQLLQSCSSDDQWKSETSGTTSNGFQMPFISKRKNKSIHLRINHTHSHTHTLHSRPGTFPSMSLCMGCLWLNPNLIFQLCSASILTQPLCQEMISRWGLIWRWTLILDGWIKWEDRRVAVESVERTTMSQKNGWCDLFPAVSGEDRKTC